jgi:hypothetical protein
LPAVRCAARGNPESGAFAREFVMTVPRTYPAEKAQTKFQHTIYIVGLAGTAVFVTFLAFVH